MNEFDMIVVAVVAVIAFTAAMYAIFRMFCMMEDVELLKSDIESARDETDYYRTKYACAKSQLRQLQSFNTALHYDEKK